MYSAADVCEHLMSTTGGGAQDQEHRVLRQSLFHAYRDLVSVRDWQWYHTAEQVQITEFVNTCVLPWGVQSVDSVMLREPDRLAEYVSPVEWERTVNSQFAEVSASVWTVMPSAFSPDRFEVRILNGQRTSQEVTLTYRRRPRDLRLTGWEPSSRVGTVDWSDISVTGTGTAFNNHMLGAILRVSGDPAYHPESLAGMHPYVDEGLIIGVDGPTALRVWSPAGAMTYTGTKYTISDYLDISPNMFTALLSGCEVWMSRLLGKNIEGATGVYGRDLRLAFEQDSLAPLSGRRGQRGFYYDFWYLRPGTDQGLPTYGVGGPQENGTCPQRPDVFGGSSDSTFDHCGGSQ